MKKDIHPQLNKVVFEDQSTGDRFITMSTMTSDDNVTLDDGNSYPLVKLEISSASHPFFTGKKTVVDTQGRVEKFKTKYQTAAKKKKK